MIFGTPKCPECEEYAKGTVEVVKGLALLAFGEDGIAEYGGETEVWWNDQKTIIDENGNVTLVCSNNHEWLSSLL